MVDVRELSTCRLPTRPTALDGLILDRVADAAELRHLQTLFESLWKAPVVGCLGLVGPLRREIDGLEAWVYSVSAEIRGEAAHTLLAAIPCGADRVHLDHHALWPVDGEEDGGGFGIGDKLGADGEDGACNVQLIVAETRKPIVVSTVSMRNNV